MYLFCENSILSSYVYKILEKNIGWNFQFIIDSLVVDEKKKKNVSFILNTVLYLCRNFGSSQEFWVPFLVEMCVVE